MLTSTLRTNRSGNLQCTLAALDCNMCKKNSAGSANLYAEGKRSQDALSQMAQQAASNADDIARCSAKHKQGLSRYSFERLQLKLSRPGLMIDAVLPVACWVTAELWQDVHVLPPCHNLGHMNCTLLEHRLSPTGHTGSTTSLRLTVADMFWLLVTLKTMLYTPATFML